MLHPSIAETALETWQKACEARISFWKANAGNWTEEVDATYRVLSKRSDDLFIQYRSMVTGKSADEIVSAINESVHSVRD